MGASLRSATASLARRDGVQQTLVWVGFVASYEVARGLADRGRGEALRNARRVVRLEEWFGGLPEPHVQRVVLHSGALLHTVDWTYWIAQFAVVTAGLVWVYLRRRALYSRLRDTLILANTAGLVVYVALPTAPPRLVPGLGLVDTMAHSEVLNHGTSLVALLANPYAAMPSIHAADAAIVGVALAAATRSRWLRALALLWPVWVCFALVATANHFVADIAAGLALAVLAGAATSPRWLMPRSRLLRGVSWSRWGGATCRRR
jgi:membrane-associated phospholipid phosphatase